MAALPSPLPALWPGIQVAEEAAMNASVRPVDPAWTPERYETYLDAHSIHEKAPGTVCIIPRHYQYGRHPIPYRLGYCHRYRLPDEHYHRTHAELVKCDEENYDR